MRSPVVLKVVMGQSSSSSSGSQPWASARLARTRCACASAKGDPRVASRNTAVTLILPCGAIAERGRGTAPARLARLVLIFAREARWGGGGGADLRQEEERCWTSSAP